MYFNVLSIISIEFTSAKECTQSYCEEKSKYMIKLEIRHSEVINRQWWQVFSCSRDIGDYLILPDHLNMNYFNKLSSEIISQLIEDVDEYSRFTFKELDKFRKEEN